jgi:hypothetical protein
MKYDPQIAVDGNFTPEETLAYQLTCHWVELRHKIFPNYRHQKISSRKGDIRKSYLYKNILKFVRDKSKNFKGFQYVLFMRAQLEVLKKIQNDGHKVVVEANCLHGEQAEKRWGLWKKKVALENATTKIEYSVVESNVEIEFEKTKRTILLVLNNNITKENYINSKLDILKFVILKKISPLYIITSKWIKLIDQETLQDMKDLSNVKKYEDYNLDIVVKTYNKFFDFEN